MKNIGVLVCDDLHAELVPEWRTYFGLFERFLETSDQTLNTHQFRVHAGEWPSQPEQMDGWVITGSRASVHELPAWVPPLKEFVRSIDKAMRPLVGICFGHQIIHAALGGKTARADAGWQLGSYPVVCEAPFASRQSGEPLQLLSVHQDQVVKAAPNFTRLATSEQVPWYASSRGKILTIQGHPEFSREFFVALMEQVRPKAGDLLVNRAIAQLPREDHSQPVREAIRQWLQG